MPTPTYVNRNGVLIKLTNTSSMPCRSWSLPAERSCPASKLSVTKLGDNAVCNSCYALKGFYRMANVKGAQSERFDWLQDSLIADGGREFIEVMTSLILQDVAERGEPIFRVHDSGDLFNAVYVKAWAIICEGLPDVQFWFPTRSHVLPALLPHIQALAALSNVTVRPSALQFDAPPPVVSGLAAGTTVIRSLPVLDSLQGVSLCPKTDPRDGRTACDDCRQCWEGSMSVAYLEH